MLSGNVRVKFAKIGKMKYISHLDLSRTLKSAFRRAGIPIWYTQGFNPHPKLVFALTVSVGTESVCEFLDIKLTEPMEKDEFIARWKNAMTNELNILDVYEPTTNFLDLTYSTYEIRFTEAPDGEKLEKALSEPMIVWRHSKKGDREEDIRPGIASLSLKDGVITAVLHAEQGNYLNPEYVVRALSEKGAASGDYQIVRTNCHFSDMREFS